MISWQAICSKMKRLEGLASPERYDSGPPYSRTISVASLIGSFQSDSPASRYEKVSLRDLLHDLY